MLTIKQRNYIGWAICANGFRKHLKPHLELVKTANGKEQAVDYTEHRASQWLEAHLDIADASQIISLFKAGDYTKAWSKLVEKGLPLK